MVAPVLAVLGGLGILSGSSIFQRRAKTRAAAVANAPFQAALNAQLSGAPLPAGQEGPTQSQAGFTPEQQSIILGLMQNGNSKVAFDQGQKFQAQNTAARNLSIQEQNQAATIAQRQQQHGLAERQFDFNVSESIRERQATADATAKAQAGLLNSALGAKQAGERGDTQYANFDPATGQTQILPVDGSADFNTGENQLKTSRDALEVMNDIRQTVAGLPIDGDPSSIITRDLQSNLTTVTIAFKNAFELGVLSGADLDLIQSLVPDPTTLREQFLSDPGALGAALTNASEILQAANARVLSQTKDWIGLDENARSGSLSAQQEAGALNQRNARFLEHAGRQALFGPPEPPTPANATQAQLAGAQGVGLIRQIGLLGAGVPSALAGLFR